MERRLAALFSADVQGYSRLMGDDEEATVQTLTAYRAVMTTLIQHHRGRVVDAPGDNLLAEFASVVDAVQCAVAVQEDLKARNAELPSQRQMVFRIGINLGDVLVEDERLYGDGVNIAARLEGLAEGGGICISGTAYDQVKNKLDVGYVSLGEHAVKNITDPVRVYQVQGEPTPVSPAGSDRRTAVGSRRRWAVLVLAVLVLGGAGATAWWYVSRTPAPSSPPVAATEQATLPPSDKPSIAVLPFTNMSGDPQQEYFADGITEDLITDLSKLSGLLVIARNSTFTYKGQSPDVRHVGRDLGVRYVLEGSIRRAGEQVRINAQLIDAKTGGLLWAERYDNRIDNVFAVQDTITRKIVAALAVTLTAGDRERLARQETENVAAYDAFLQGWEYLHRHRPEAIGPAITHLERALQLDPDFPRANAALAAAYGTVLVRSWHTQLGIGLGETHVRGKAYLKKALEH
ncbi:MAG: adenylate/guanylate cyclase domain-containing protein, partial [Candidatus Tectomicrobia bacterium]